MPRYRCEPHRQRKDPIPVITDSMTLDELTFEVRVSRRRKTIGIIVHRTGRLSLALPYRCPLTAVEAAVRKKLPWVRRKLAEMEHLGQLPEPRRYVDGETFPYLGRTYRLALVDRTGGRRAVPGERDSSGRADTVRLHRGRFELDRALAGDERSQMVAWYTARGRDWVEKRMAIFAPLVGAEPAVLSVRDLGRRWGSCSAKGKVSFHWQIMLFPPLIADYVIVHELAHLRELNHGKEYWRLVEAIIPDYRERRAWLAGNGHRHVV